MGSKDAESLGDVRKEVGAHIVQLEPGSKEGTITLAEYRVRASVQADMEKLWTERMEKEDKIMLNKYETLNSTVESLGSEIINFQAWLTNILQRHWEWQEDRRTDLGPGFYRYNTAFVASLDVKTSFDVAKPSVVSRILSLTGVHDHAAAVENGETNLRCSRCIRQGALEAPVLWRACGQIRGVESRGKVQGQRMGSYLRRRIRLPVGAAGHDVGGQLLAVL